jgi:hypothetical protein
MLGIGQRVPGGLKLTLGSGKVLVFGILTLTRVNLKLLEPPSLIIMGMQFRVSLRIPVWRMWLGSIM